MMALTRMRPSSMARHSLVGTARAPKVEADAGEDHRNQDQRNRPPEETRAKKAYRLLQGILGDLSENDPDDERRARPIVPLEQVTQASHYHDQDEVLPNAAIQITAEQCEDQNVRNEESRLHRAESADPWTDGNQHDHAKDVRDDERPDQRPDDVDMFGQHGRPGLDAKHQKRSEHDRHARRARYTKEQGRKQRSRFFGAAAGFGADHACDLTLAKPFGMLR